MQHPHEGRKEKTVTFQHKPRKRPAQKSIPVLIISALGIVGIVALVLLVPGFQPIDIALLLVVVGLGAAGYTQDTLRGIATVVMIYVATGTAATFYQKVSPYVGAIQQTLTLNLEATVGENIDRGTLALSFSLLAMIIWIVLETIARLSFRDTSLPALGILDKLGGVFVHLIVGILVASLLFNAIGYGRSRRVHDKALLRPEFNQVLYLYYNTQSFWFPRNPPPIYVYDLDRRR
jgi:hypothetical protein